MNEIEKEQLRMEIQHIFDSGANEIRIFEMVKSFMDSRNGVNKLLIPRVRQSLPKQLSNAAYLNARDMDYENFVKWWDEQV